MFTHELIETMIAAIEGSTKTTSIWFEGDTVLAMSDTMSALNKKILGELAQAILAKPEYLASITQIMGGYVLLLKDPKANSVFGLIFPESFSATPITAVSELTRIAHLLYPFFAQSALQKESIDMGKFTDMTLDQLDDRAEKVQLDKRIQNHQGAYEFEQILVSYVRAARIDKIAASFHSLRMANTDSIVTDSVMDVTIKTICLATVFARVAIEENVPVSAAFALSDAIIRKSLIQTNLADASAFTEASLHHFAELIAKYKYQKFPFHVQNVLKYIHAHLYESMSLEAIAKACHYSPWHLSRIFKEDMGISINDMIHFEKINEAKVLLRFTTTPTKEIANLLCYAQQSHFIHHFKRLEGMTPETYRKQHDSRDLANLTNLVQTL